MQVVADDHHPETLVGEPDELEHLLGLGDAERGGRLVEDDELAFWITAIAIATDWRWPPESEETVVRTEPTVVSARVSSVPRLRAPSPLAQEQPAIDLAAKRHALHDIQVVGEGEVLVNNFDAELGGASAVDDHLLALKR